MDASSVATHKRRRLMEGVLLAGVLAALAAIGCHRAEPNVVLLGDSVTAGYGASDSAHSWTSLLGVPVSGEAAPGEPSGFFLGQSWQADAVVVELGINDCSHGVPPVTYGDHMRQILANITAPRVVLVVPYRAGGFKPPVWDAYADQLLAIARSDSRVSIVDLRPVFGSPTTTFLAPDLIHPNDRGHAVIARLVSQAIGV